MGPDDMLWYLYVRVCVCVCAFLSLSISRFVYVCKYIYIYTHMYTYMYKYIREHIQTYTLDPGGMLWFQNFNRKNGKSRNSCIVKVGDVGVEGMMMLQRIGTLV